MKKIILIIAGIVALTTMLMAFDGPGFDSREKHGRDFEHPGFGPEFESRNVEGSMFERIRDELDITKEQIKQMDELRSSNKKECIKLKSDMDILQVDKKDALKEFNFKEAKKITGKIFEIKKNLAVKRIEMQEKRWNILDADQQAKVEEMMQQRGHHKKPFGKMDKMKRK
ncbi:MAG: hypothetical protein HQ534_11120 [Armatimonadetes bacterium]|nr:hypothetical protein [Armatimonadota bacterium]